MQHLYSTSKCAQYYCHLYNNHAMQVCSIPVLQIGGHTESVACLKPPNDFMEEARFEPGALSVSSLLYTPSLQG